MTATIEYAETRTTDNAGEATHIVMVPPGEDDQTPQAYVLRARVEGFPITALCGYTWNPSKDPTPLPVCARCLDIYQQTVEHRDERDEIPDA
jgi:hypothetical protein